MTSTALNWVDVDKLVHEPARLVILTILAAVDQADFLYLLREANLTRGNLSAHLSKLEEAEYIQVEKTYRGRLPLTLVQLTSKGRQALDEYRIQLKKMLGDT
jgi:DNA-binding MarR family transcriptional regulator